MNNTKGTSLKVFSIVQNCKSTIEKEKPVPLDKIQSAIWYERTPKIFMKEYKRIWNEIENGFYSYKDLKNHLLYTYIWNKNIKYLNDIENKNINNTKGKLTEKQFKKDKEFILKLNKKVNLKSIEDFFIIREEGSNLIYDLVLKKFVSPIFFMRISDKLKLNETNVSNDYKRFKSIISLIET